MRAASRAASALLVAVSLCAIVPATAAAAADQPACPVEIGDQPLSVAVPFSGTPRPVAGPAGEIDQISLLCAYGEGVEASAQIVLEWEPDAEPACGTTTTDVAEGLDAAAFAAAADELAADVGGPCPPARSRSFPVGKAATAVGVAILLAALTVAVRRRRAREPDAPQPQEPSVVVEHGREREQPVGDRPSPRDEPALIGSAVRRPSDFGPILQQLRSDDALARSTTGQWMALAALAYGVGNDEAGAVARRGALQALPDRRPARADLAALARRLTHQGAGADR